MREIELTQGKVTLVDDADYEWLSSWKWCANTNGSRSHWYARRNCYDGPHRTTVRIHRVIMDAQPGEQVDHINRNGLDNRRENLRICSHSENQHNAAKRRGCSSRYKGIYWHKGHGKWVAQVGLTGSRHHLGYFVNEIDAAHAYDDAARELHGEFACVNFPRDGEQSALGAK